MPRPPELHTPSADEVCISEESAQHAVQDVKAEAKHECLREVIHAFRPIVKTLSEDWHACCMNATAAVGAHAAEVAEVLIDYFEGNSQPQSLSDAEADAMHDGFKSVFAGMMPMRCMHGDFAGIL